MTTWVEFQAAGFRIERDGKHDPKLTGPRELLADLRFEIDSRLALVGDGEDFATWLPSKVASCAHCGDAAPNFGTCGLCELARAKALRMRRERAA